MVAAILGVFFGSDGAVDHVMSQIIVLLEYESRTPFPRSRLHSTILIVLHIG